MLYKKNICRFWRHTKNTFCCYWRCIIDKSFVVKSNEDYATGDRVKQYENIRSYASRYAVKGNKLLDKIEKGVLSFLKNLWALSACFLFALSNPIIM